MTNTDTAITVSAGTTKITRASRVYRNPRTRLRRFDAFDFGFTFCLRAMAGELSFSARTDDTVTCQKTNDSAIGADL
jgi:hypothetical protein